MAFLFTRSFAATATQIEQQPLAGCIAKAIFFFVVWQISAVYVFHLWRWGEKKVCACTSAASARLPWQSRGNKCFLVCLSQPFTATFCQRLYMFILFLLFFLRLLFCCCFLIPAVITRSAKCTSTYCCEYIVKCSSLRIDGSRSEGRNYSFHSS